MRYTLYIAIVILNCCSIAQAASCDGLANLRIDQGRITSARIESGKNWAPPGWPAQPDIPSFCRVSILLTPTTDSQIRVEVWMPTANWNGRYEGLGNGGFAGGIDYGELARGVRMGFAAATTDMGTAPSTVTDADALIGHPEKWADWGWRSTHDMTVAAKRVVRAYYGRSAEYSYFLGCSTGGEQGLMEAQRFPDDYDGIAAGGAANDRTRLHMEILWNYKMLTSGPDGRFPMAKLHLITESVLKACTSAKTVASDDFLADPPACSWDPGEIECKGADAPNCLTKDQVEIVRKVYQGPRNPVTGASIYPGLSRGSEYGWGDLMPATGGPPYASLFRWVFGADWNWRSFDFNRDVAIVDARLAASLNATDPNLEPFRARGHKLITYHGWADPLVPPQESINYYKQVEEAEASNAHARSANHEANNVRDFYRLFMIPGMAHCSGGPGLNEFDPIVPLESWVEQGIAPEKIIARRMEGSITVMTRPVCPYPESAHFNGTGDPKNAESFTCAEPDFGANR